MYHNTRSAEVRPCRLDDAPAVANLFQKTFRDPRRPAPASLQACLRDLFFKLPWRDPDLPSLVYASPADDVRGFIGVIPVSIMVRGRSMRGAVASSLVVDDPKADPFAGAKLLRAFLAGPQDLSISETANATTQGMWERLGGTRLDAESMEWLRVLQPAGLAVAAAQERMPAIGLLRPIAPLLDRLVSRFVELDAPASATRDEDASDDELVRSMPEFAASYAVGPQWEPTPLKWMLDHAAHNRARGPLHRRIVYGGSGAPVGCYLYQGRPGHIGWVLQVLARPKSAEAALDALFAHARSQECVALKGRTNQRLLDPLLRRRCLFFRRHCTLVHARDPELSAAIRDSESILTGFAAETWMRVIGDRFA